MKYVFRCDAYKSIYEEKGGEICEKNLGDIKAPTLILHGDKDPMVDQVHPVCLNEKIKGSRYVNIPFLSNSFFLDRF